MLQYTQSYIMVCGHLFPNKKKIPSHSWGKTNKKTHGNNKIKELLI